MTFIENDKGQMYTMEGVAASIVLLGVLLFIVQTNAVVVPQTEKSIDVNLYLIAGDTLACLDRLDESGNSTLKLAVASWNGAKADYQHPVADGEASIERLTAEIAPFMPVNARYNLYVTYDNGATAALVVNGKPGDNSVAVSRLVTLNDKDAMSPYWKNMGGFPRVVEVRMVCWYL